MNKGYRKTLLAGAIAALIAGPVAGAQHESQAQDVPGAIPEQPVQETPQYSPSTPQPMNEQAGTVEQPTAESGSMLALTPDDLHRQEVIGSNGEAIGRISEVVGDRGGSEVYAVISTGGFLGLIGGTKHVVPLSELRLEERKLHIDTTQEDLAAREEYIEDRYLVVKPDDRPISEFSAFEQMEDKASEPVKSQEQQPGQQGY